MSFVLKASRDSPLRDSASRPSPFLHVKSIQIPLSFRNATSLERSRLYRIRINQNHPFGVPAGQLSAMAKLVDALTGNPQRSRSRTQGKKKHSAANTPPPHP